MGQVRRSWKGPARYIGLVVAMAVVFAATGALDAAATVRDEAASGGKAQTLHVVASDADVYLDVDALLPPSYAMTTDDRSGSVTSRAYAVADGTSGVTLTMVLGRGDRSRDRAVTALDDPAPYVDDETIATLADEVGLPRDQVTARNGPWTPVDVAVQARSSTNAVDIADEGSITYEVVQFVATWRDEVALGEVVAVHFEPGAVDPIALAGAIAERVASGPPSRRARLVAAGLVRGTDLPGEWQVEPAPRSGTGDTAPSGGSDSGAGAGVIRDSAQHDRACDRYAGTIDAAAATGGAGRNGAVEQGTGEQGAGDHTTSGPRFRSGFDQAQSAVWVSSERAARATFHEMHAPAFMHCLRTLYSAVVDASLGSLPLDAVSVDVDVEDLPATGDDALLATVRLDAVNGRHVITEVVFLRVGAAQGVYTFSTASDTTVRSSVLAEVVHRLEDAT